MDETVSAKFFGEEADPRERYEDALGRITALAEKFLKGEDEIGRRDEAVEEARGALGRINDEIVSIVEEAGIIIPDDGWTVTAPSGRAVKIKEAVHGSCSKANQAALVAWLDAHGEAGMVKRNLSLSFDREKYAEAILIRDLLRARYPDADSKEAVNHQTLAAWIRRRLRAGEELPDCVSFEVTKRVSVS